MATNGNSTALVERLIDAGTVTSRSSASPDDFSKAVRDIGYQSVFDIIRESKDAFARKLEGAWVGSDRELADTVYDNALCCAAQASLVYRHQRLSRGRAPRGSRTGLRSLVDVGPGYETQVQGELGQFCRHGGP